MSDAFEQLAQRLDALPNGFPRTKSGIELKILKKIYTEDEAEITTSLKLLPQTPEQIAEGIGHDAAGMAEKLEDMVYHGKIAGVGPKDARMYHIVPWVIGIYEFQMPFIDKELSELFEEYIEEGKLFEEIGKYSPGFLFAIPIEEAIDAQQEIHPYENVREMMNGATAFITRDCICRKEQRLLGNDCGKPQGNCISFSKNENAFDDDPHGRIVDRAEAERIMKEAADAGMVHSTMNMDDDTYHFCNCCPTCCGLLRGTKRFNKPGVLVKSNFCASIDEDACVQCGTCADERCPMEAISEGDDSYVVDRDRCLGCGVCVPTCPSEAISLVRKPADECVQAPANMVAWMMERSVGTGKSLESFM